MLVQVHILRRRRGRFGSEAWYEGQSKLDRSTFALKQDAEAKRRRARVVSTQVYVSKLHSYRIKADEEERSGRSKH